MNEQALMVANVGDSPWAFSMPKGIRLSGINGTLVTLWFRPHIRSEPVELMDFTKDGLYDLEGEHGFYRITQSTEDTPLTVTLVR